jgi:DNA-binding beta-propeller fold protein YncE
VNGNLVLQWGTSAVLSTAAGIAVDAAGNIYVSDVDNSRIQKFDPTGAYLAQWGNPSY